MDRLTSGATAPSRRYRADHYREVSQDLISNYDLQVVFTGNETEVELVEEICRNIPSDLFSLAGKLNVGELSALIAMADLLITNNTGPAHIAAAVQTPVVVLYALTNPQHTPWMVPQRVLYHDVPCRYCYKSICPMGHHNCLELVSPETVLHAVFELLVLNEQENSNNTLHPDKENWA
ncbi:MAG: glycosyltransferase family 9 protein [Anaerolineales bacterium]